MIPLWGPSGGAGAVFSQAAFWASLTHSLVLDAGTGSPTFTRATTATVRDHEGVLRTAISGEARFEGARRVQNLLTFTEDFSNAAWTKLASGTGVTPVVTPNYAEAPDGTSTAIRIQLDVTVAGGGGDYSIVRQTASPTPTTSLRSLWMKSNTGANQTVSMYFNASEKTVTTEWQRFDMPATAGTHQFFDISKVGTSANKSADILVWHPQLEDITGRADQTTPSEYVSVGALDYRSEQDPLYLSLPGTNGHCATTPDSVAASPTGDIELVFDGAATDWTPTADQVLICKDDAGVQRDILLFLRLATARVELWTSATGASYAGRAASATAALPFSDGQRGQIKVTRSAATGDTNFYTSTDGSTWTQLGTTVSTTAGAIHDGTAGITVGALGDASKTIPFGGKIYSATLATSIGGTPVVDFNPHRDATTPTGTITSSTTGEVWTINGASSVVRNAAYRGAGVDGVEYFPYDLDGNPIAASTNTGYLAEGARTQLLTYSQDGSNAIWSVTGQAKSVSGTAPDGTATLNVLTNDTANSAHRMYHNGDTLAAATTGTASVYLVAGTQRYVTVGQSSGVTGFWVTIDTQTWTITQATATAGATYTSSSIERTATGARVSVTGQVAALVSYHTIGASDVAVPATFAPTFVGASETIKWWGAQLEATSTVSSYIATTTGSIARAADVLTYTASAGNVSGTVGAAYAEVASSWTSAGVNGGVIEGNSAGTGHLLYKHFSDNVATYDGTNFTTSSVAATSTTKKFAQSYSGTSVKIVGTGGSVVSGTFDGDYSVGANIGIGVYPDGSSLSLFGTIRNVRIWQRALSNSELQAITR